MNSNNQVNAGGFAYDLAGNATGYVTQQGGVATATSLSYDAEDRVATNTASSAYSNAYDPFGLRAYEGPSGTPTNFYLYDGGSLLVEIKSGAVSRAYGWAADGLRELYTGSVYMYAFDPEGNVSMRGKDGYANQWVDDWVFDSYGQQAFHTNTVGSNSNGNPDVVGFAAQQGGYYDTDQGINLMGRRWYDSGSGKFVNRDPIGYAGGMNVYGYAGGNPITGSDASGYWWTKNQWERAGGDVLAGAGGFLVGGPIGAAIGVGAFEGTYHYAEGHSVKSSVEYGAVVGVTAYAGGAALSKVGAVALASPLGQRVAGAVAARIAGSTASTASSSIAAAIPASISATFNIAKDGLFEGSINTSAGVVEIAAEASSQGSMLALKDIAIYPAEGAKLIVGSKEILLARTALMDWAKSNGYSQLHITGIRYSGANPGKVIDTLINLK